MRTIEEVNVITEDNKVVGRVSKSEAHRKGLLHRIVIAEVIGSDGKWTLCKQAGDRQDPSRLVSPIGGHVRSGEKETDALFREAAEEYGLRAPFAFRPVGSLISHRTVLDRHESHLFLVYEIDSDQIPKMNKESVSYERLSPLELRTQLTKNPQKFGEAFHLLIRTLYPDLKE